MTKLNELNLTINKPYYVISGLELDVEFDYISSEERQDAVTELESMIQEQGIEQRIGESVIHEDDIIYTPSDNSIEHAEMMFYYAAQA